jgi:hypothetical protein
VVVITNAATDGALANKLSYAAPAGVHVVVDAPVDSAGKSDVSATLDGSNCRVTVTPHQGSATGYDGRPLIVRLDTVCNVSDDGTQVMPPLGGGAVGTGGTPNAMGGSSAGPPNNGSAGEGGSASDGSANEGGAAETLSPHGSPASGGTGGSGAKPAGGVSGLGRESGGRAAAAPVATTPTTPELSSCSLGAGAGGQGPGAAFAGAFIGLLLLARTRRRAGFVPR